MLLWLMTIKVSGPLKKNKSFIDSAYFSCRVRAIKPFNMCSKLLYSSVMFSLNKVDLVKGKKRKKKKTEKREESASGSVVIG